MTMRHVRGSGLLNLGALALLAATALPACGGSVSGSPATTMTDGGVGGSDRPATPPANTGGCPALCAHLRAAACGAFNEQCVAACQQLASRVPSECRARFDAFITCGATATITCVSDGPEIGGCEAQSSALEQCGDDEPPGTDRCLPDSSIPTDIAAQICVSVPATPVPHDCPGGAPSAGCVPSPGGEANVFCCTR